MDLINCRVCFVNNVKMHNVINTSLQELYEKLTNIKLTRWSSKADRPTILCSMCYAHLKRCYLFQRAATKSEHLLAQLFLDRVALTQDQLIIERPPVHNYVATPVEHVNIYSSDFSSTNVEQRKQTEQEEAEDKESDYECGDEILEESQEESQEEVIVETTKATKSTKVRQVKLNQDHESELSVSTVSVGNDSDDDVPLHALKSTLARQKKDKGVKRKYNACKLDAREIILTEEQQKEAITTRAFSLNYLNSPFCCTLCYRGFTNKEAYANHMDKHLESSGAHACPLCQLRYRSARLLRAHAHAAHERRYVCNQCGHSANTRHQASDHQRLHSGEYYECKLCGKTFHARTSYLTHVRCTHAGGAACAACGRRFVSEHGRRMHEARAHRAGPEEAPSPSPAPAPGPPRPCPACGVQFRSRRAHVTHLLGRRGRCRLEDDATECPICSQAIVGPVSAHFALHEKELKRARPPAPALANKLDCDQCPRSFPLRARLLAHVRRVHLGLKYDKNLVCEHCGKKCTSGATLRSHQRTHTGERPYACPAPACGRRFADNNQLRIHTRTHTGERPYACQRCGRRFAQKPALNRHYRVHTGAKPYTCELCSKSFSQSNSLNTHVKAVHLKLSVRRRPRTTKKKADGDSELTAVKEILGK